MVSKLVKMALLKLLFHVLKNSYSYQYCEQVLKECGKPSYSDAKTSPYKESVSPTPHVKERLFAKMDAVHRQLNALNSFFQDLAREFCVVDGLASQKENIDNCWNGTFVAR